MAGRCFSKTWDSSLHCNFSLSFDPPTLFGEENLASLKLAYMCEYSKCAPRTKLDDSACPANYRVNCLLRKVSTDTAQARPLPPTDVVHPSSKRQKFSHPTFPPSVFQDNLSEKYLTRNALRELDQRNALYLLPCFFLLGSVASSVAQNTRPDLRLCQ